MCYKFSIWISGFIAFIAFYLIFENLSHQGEVLLGFFSGAILAVLTFVMSFGLVYNFCKSFYVEDENKDLKVEAFANDNNKNGGFFEMPGYTSERISPARFGYLLVFWSDQATQETINEMDKALEVSGKNSHLEKAYLVSYYVRLQLLAVYTASYYAFPTSYFTIPSNYFYDIDKGILDAIKDYKTPDGESISDGLVYSFLATQKKYRNEISKYIMFENSEDFGITTVHNYELSNESYKQKIFKNFLSDFNGVLESSGRFLNGFDIEFLEGYFFNIPDEVITAMKVAGFKYIP